MSRVAGKRAVVTGGGSGIGRATVLRLASEGARVGVVDIDRGAADAVAAAVEAEGGEACSLPADVTDEQDVAQAVARAVDEWGGLDVVVASAAVQLFGRDDKADRLDLAIWQRTVAVNFTGVFLTCKHGVRALLESGGGSVVCVASPTGLYGVAPGFTAYSASKAGVYGLVKVTAADYAAQGIRVNAVVPGFTDTPLVRTIMADDAQREELLRKIPLGRPGTAEEVASLILFLASDESAYVTGAAFFGDGGLTAI